MSVLLIIACGLLLLAGLGCHWGQDPRIHFGWLGMAFWCLSVLYPGVRFNNFGFGWVIVVVLTLVIIALLVRPRSNL